MKCDPLNQTRIAEPLDHKWIAEPNVNCWIKCSTQKCFKRNPFYICTKCRNWIPLVFPTLYPQCIKHPITATHNFVPLIEKFTQQSTCEWVKNVLFNDALNTFYLRLYGIGSIREWREILKPFLAEKKTSEHHHHHGNTGCLCKLCTGTGFPHVLKHTQVLAPIQPN